MSNNIISREEYQVKKLMEGLGKNKTAQAAAAAETEKEKKVVNKEANEYMPKYIVQAPWYLNQKEESLAHQRAQGGKSKIGINEWYQRGVQETAAYKYRKGACENCGAITHKVKDCVERPRKIGAKWSGQDIRPDEYVQKLELDYDAKRDRWSGYNPEMFTEVMREHEEQEELLKQMRHQALEEGKPDAVGDDFKEGIFEGSEPVAKQDPKIKTNTRNLRIREDTAKYLLNLNEDSAYYDGKTHSMRENPNIEGDQAFKGDNYARLTGDTVQLLEQEKFIWDLVQKESAELNSVANPTAAELIYRKAKEKITQQAQEKNRRLVEKYGESQVNAPDFGVVLGQTEAYVEYTPDGKIKSQRNAAKSQVGKSRYEEDVFPNDHTSVWGSWWNEELGWGYACCHQNEKQSMCIGERGKKQALLREFKIKKAKKEQMSTFAKVVAKEEGVTDLSEFQQAEPVHEEKLQTEQVKVQEPPVPIKQETKPEEEKKQEKAPENNKPLDVEIGKPKNKEVPLEIVKKKPSEIKKVQRKNSATSSSSDSSASSDDSSSESDSDSSRSASSSSSRSKSSSKGGRRKKASHLQKKMNNRQKDKNIHKGLGDRDLKKELKKEEKKVKQAHANLDDRKRAYNSVKGDNNDVSIEEIEAYKLVKKRFDDPMYHA